MGKDEKVKVEGIEVFFEINLNSESNFKLVDQSFRINLLQVYILEKLGYDFYLGNEWFL